MKKVAIFLAGAFILAISFVVAREMSADAMAVVVGIVCGIGASIPTSLLILILMKRKEVEESPRPYAGVPPVMIVTPPAGMYPPQYQPPAASYLTPLNGGAPRQFQVLGGEEDSESRAGW